MPGSRAAESVSVRRVVVVGGSTAGSTAMRELRRRGFDGELVLVDPARGTNRPPLSKAVLAADMPDESVLIDHSSIDAQHVLAAAVGLDTCARVLTTADGAEHPYDALVIASGSTARRIAAAGQRGELVLRTLDDARTLRHRLTSSSSVVVVGGGFLGMEVATAAATAGATVTVVDVEPPLRRVLGAHLAADLLARAEATGVRFVQSTAVLVGEPVTGVELADGSTLTADAVVSCVGDIPATAWLDGTGLPTAHGIEIDMSARTSVADVYAIGDVAAVRSGHDVRRAPYWANAVTQARVAAAAILGQDVEDPIVDHYFWTEIAGVSVKAVGPLPVAGVPTTFEDAGDGHGILTWDGPTVVAYGVRRSVPKLRATARGLTEASV
ncbi:ferredoxin reductase [Aeromicrobium fastidiosum]|uniref:Ferredoxin reductase n=1 Tax=Aeromicrobium fastidiosum TaxID=52699 RepID=A0A641ANH3_9ACTN|nr:ferredoxin reductase [Aeromicrobium fastidiosum]